MSHANHWSDILDVLSRGSIDHPVWHLAPLDRWRLLRDTLLGHGRLRGGVRPRDLPLDPTCRRSVAVATWVQRLEYDVGGRVRISFGDWLYLYAVLVEPACTRGSSDADAQASTALCECVLELRRALGMSERGTFTDTCPFLHGCLGALGLSRQEWRRLSAASPSAPDNRVVARVGSRICAVQRGRADVRAAPGHVADLSRLAEDIGLQGSDAALLERLGRERRVVATLKPIDVQNYLHRAKSHWMMRGASTWCGQALAFARDELLRQLDGLLLSDSDAIVSFLIADPSATPSAALQCYSRSCEDPSAFSARYPRLGPCHPHGDPRCPSALVAMPTLSLRFTAQTSLLDLCLARIDDASAVEATIGGVARSPAFLPPDAEPCHCVEGEAALTAAAPAWHEERGGRRPDRYGWSALVWSLCGTTMRTHWHHGICAALDRRDYAMMPVHHGDWLGKLGLADDRLTFVKLDGDGIGDTFAALPVPSRPSRGLTLATTVIDRVMAGTRRVIESHDAAGGPKFLPVDLVYFGGDDITVCMADRYVATFLDGFGAPLDGVAADDWGAKEFSFISVSLPPAADFPERGEERSAVFARANLAASRLLAPALRHLGKPPRRRDDAVLASLAEAIAAHGFRCDWADPLPVSGCVRGASLSLARRR